MSKLASSFLCFLLAVTTALGQSLSTEGTLFDLDTDNVSKAMAGEDFDELGHAAFMTLSGGKLAATRKRDAQTLRLILPVLKKQSRQPDHSLRLSCRDSSFTPLS